MRKIFLCLLAVLLCSCFTLGQTVPQWKTIKVVTVNGAANVSSTTVFTPTAAGTYRVTATFAQKGGGTSEWIAGFLWTDQLGAGGSAPLKVGPTLDWASTTFMFNPVPANLSLTTSIKTISTSTNITSCLLWNVWNSRQLQNLPG